MTPIGTAISAASPVRISVPTMALAMPPPGSPTGCGIVREEIEVERLDALADDEEQDERQRHEREQHRQRAGADEQRGQDLARRRGADAASCARAFDGTCRAIVQISPRDNPLTISVMMKRTRPISTSADRYSASVGFGELVGDHRRHRVLRREQRQRHLRVVPDHHRHRHRLAERAAEAEHDRADDAGARVEHGGADRLEARGAERVGRLALRRAARSSAPRARRRR